MAIQHKLKVNTNNLKADLLLYNANVITMDAANPRAEFIAMSGDRIIGVGKNEDRQLYENSHAKIVDCEEMTIVPGFHDAHIHFFALASGQLSVNLGPSAVASIAEIENLISKKAKQIPAGEWIKGAEYNEFYLSEEKHPNRQDLDRAAPDHPVKITHRSRHACVLNSLGLKMAGINIETPDPPGGIIERDYDTGEPTGLLFGMNAYLSREVLPPPSADDSELGIRKANEVLLSSGITSIQDATAQNGFADWELFHKMKVENKLRPRVTMMIGFYALEQFQDLGPCHQLGNLGLRLGAVKILTDETRGPLNPSQKDLNNMVFYIHDTGFQVAIHAIEESTVDAATVAIEQTLKLQPRTNHRHRIEHCAECPPYLLDRLKNTQTIVVTQPAFIYNSGERYLSTVSPPMLPWLYPMGFLINNGITLAASSDGPIVPVNPLVSIYAAVTRKAEKGQLLTVKETITPQQAIWAHTMGGAYAAFEEDYKGSISEGKLADLVILTDDPTRVDPEEIKDIKVLTTIIDGQIVWKMD